jgi:hypothetical protein
LAPDATPDAKIVRKKMQEYNFITGVTIMNDIAAPEKTKKRTKSAKATGLFIEMTEKTKIDPKRVAELHAKRHEYFLSLTLPKGCKSVADMIRKNRDTGYR